MYRCLDTYAYAYANPQIVATNLCISKCPTIVDTIHTLVEGEVVIC